jgi:hypothetical protein
MPSRRGIPERAGLQGAVTPKMNFEGATPRVSILTGGRLPPPTDLDGLAEVGKPKSNWELQGVLGLAVFVLGFLAGK